MQKPLDYVEEPHFAPPINPVNVFTNCKVCGIPYTDDQFQRGIHNGDILYYHQPTNAALCSAPCSSKYYTETVNKRDQNETAQG